MLCEMLGECFGCIMYTARIECRPTCRLRGDMDAGSGVVAVVGLRAL